MPAVRRLLLLLLTLSSSAATALAQDAPPKLDDPDPLDFVAPQPIPQPFIAMSSDSRNSEVQRWVFGSGTDQSVATRQLTGQLNLFIRDIDFACDLSPPQEYKLELAGRGDIKHFFDQVKALEDQYLGVVRHRDGRELVQRQELQDQARQLRFAYRSGIFEEGSLLEKIARGTLTPKQLESLRELRSERRHQQYLTHLGPVLADLQNKLSLTPDQNEQLRALILSETRPPLRWGDTENFAAQVVLIQIGRIPEDQLRAVLTDKQWPRMRAQLQEANGLEKFLRGNGWLPGDK